MLNKTNKCQINAKKGGKIFLVFFMLGQKISSQNKNKKKQKYQIFHTMGQGGANGKKGCEQQVDSGPAQVNFVFNLQQPV